MNKKPIIPMPSPNMPGPAKYELPLLLLAAVGAVAIVSVVAMFVAKVIRCSGAMGL